MKFSKYRNGFIIAIIILLVIFILFALPNKLTKKSPQKSSPNLSYITNQSTGNEAVLGDKIPQIFISYVGVYGNSGVIGIDSTEEPSI